METQEKPDSAAESESNEEDEVQSNDSDASDDEPTQEDRVIIIAKGIQRGQQYQFNCFFFASVTYSVGAPRDAILGVD